LHHLDPAAAFAEFIDSQKELKTLTVAYSGGLDSHVLLHMVSLLSAARADLNVRALHVNHGLHSESDDWAEHARSTARALNVACSVVKVEVNSEHGEGPEAAARLARYSAFAEHIVPGEHIMLAQHADDQAETLLLQALRGSGVDGLASIPRKRTFALGFMSRPLLNSSRNQLQLYAEEHELKCIHDPSNDDTHFDRNFLRHNILPLLKERWPAATRTLARTANRCSAASQTLQGLAQEDLRRMRIKGVAELSVSELKNLPRERAYNVLRLWVRHDGYRMPRLQDLAEVYRQLVLSRSDSHGIVNVRDYEFRRHRDRLYLLPPQGAPVSFNHQWKAPIRLPESGAITVRSRVGSELIKLGEPAFHKAVKKLMQEAAVPPWLRQETPLLYVDDRLAAVWEVAVAIDFRQAVVSSSEAV